MQSLGALVVGSSLGGAAHSQGHQVLTLQRLAGYPTTRSVVIVRLPVVTELDADALSRIPVRR